MSEANRKQMTKLIFSLWDHVIAGISESRGISEKELNEVADNLSVFERNENALEKKLIDGLLYKDELLAELRDRLGLEGKEKIPFVKLIKYMAAEGSKGKKKYTRNKIAVVYALGSIGMGEGDDYTIGADRISKAIRQARLDTNIRAIVLRVNSPGGDALASDIILRELILAKKEKPVVASYGNVAASGGYWISCQADKIIADENTITGSIGVFGFLPNLQGFYNDKLGITFDNAATNENAGFPSINRRMTGYEGIVMQTFVESVYQKFLEYVSEARNMTVEEVDEIAQGRVWSGTDAKEIGLIDDLGGLDDAIILAAEMAELEEYKILSLPKQKDPFQQIMDELMGKSTESMIEKELGVNYKYYHYIKDISEMKGVQARLPFEISIN
jgi:protease-4